MVSLQMGASLQPDTVDIQVVLWEKDMDNFVLAFMVCYTGLRVGLGDPYALAQLNSKGMISGQSEFL